MARIAFIGLGNMGGPMAANLVKAGHEVTGFDLASTVLKAAEESGVKPASHASQAVKGAEIILTMLPQGKHVLTAWADILQSAEKGALVIDCSTIDVESSRKAHELARGAGCLSLDAPVSGGTGGATAGTLTFMAGGSEESFAKARP